MTDQRKQAPALHLGRVLARFLPTVSSAHPTLGRPGATLGLAIGGSSGGESREGVPVKLGDVPAKQVSDVTCGAAVLLMLNVTADPELREEIEADPALMDDFQTSLHFTSTRNALGPFAWPQRFGTPPWALARAARFPGVTYTHRPVDDSSDDAGAVFAWIWHATQAGIPVPLYTGGDASQSLDRAIPRHVVLAVPPPTPDDLVVDPALNIYDPASAKVYRVPIAELVNRTERHPALGNWTHVVWAVLPRPE